RYAALSEHVKRLANMLAVATDASVDPIALSDRLSKVNKLVDAQSLKNELARLQQTNPQNAALANITFSDDGNEGPYRLEHDGKIDAAGVAQLKNALGTAPDEINILTNFSKAPYCTLAMVKDDQVYLHNGTGWEEITAFLEAHVKDQQDQFEPFR